MKLIALSLYVSAQLVCLGYTTLKIANQFAAKLIDNGVSQSLVSDKKFRVNMEFLIGENTAFHETEKGTEKGAEVTTPFKTTFTAIHTTFLL